MPHFIYGEPGKKGIVIPGPICNYNYISSASNLLGLPPLVQVIDTILV